MQRENPAIDRWISKPDCDAHVYVLVERLPAEAVADMETLERAYLDDAKEHAKSLRVFTAPAVKSPVANALSSHAP